MHISGGSAPSSGESLEKRHDTLGKRVVISREIEEWELYYFV
jgi:hypothetical protein